MIRYNIRHPQYSCFSNFYKCNFEYNGIKVNTVEAVFQAYKTTDKDEFERIIHMTNPADAKRAGRQVNLRVNWEDVKYGIMLSACLAKFKQNEDLAEILLSTGNQMLLEDTTGWHDNIWGHCTCAKCIDKPYQNLAGKALMEVRDLLRKK